MPCRPMIVWLVGAAVVLGACGGGGGNNNTTKAAAGGSIDVNAYDVHFDVGTITASAGKLQINLHEKGSQAHTFKIPDLNFEIKVDSGTTNASGTITLPAGAHTYKFFCSTSNHSATMHGQIVVS